MVMFGLLLSTSLLSAKRADSVAPDAVRRTSNVNNVCEGKEEVQYVFSCTKQRCNVHAVRLLVKSWTRSLQCDMTRLRER